MSDPVRQTGSRASPGGSGASSGGSAAGFEPAVARWRAMVEAEHAQTDRLRGEAPPEDYWSPFAGQFRPDLAGPEDPTLRLIAPMVSPDWEILDVGAGGGRLALLLARLCRRVTAVEPSAAMAAELREAARINDIGNVSVVETTWEEADVQPADLVVCAHVLYTSREVGAFLRKMEERARARVVVALFTDTPQWQLFPFWERVYGEERLRLPGLTDLMGVLWEMGVYPDLTMLPPRISQGYPDRERARELIRARLFIAPGSEQDRRLGQAMDELLVPQPDGGVKVKGVSERRAGLVTWRPADTTRA